MKAELLIDRPAGVGAMQRDHANLALPRFGEAEFDQLVGQPFLPEFRFHVDIQQITTVAALRMERMRRPIDDEQPGRAGNSAVYFRDPAQVPAIGEPLHDPGLKGAAHSVKDRGIRVGHGGKHGAPMLRDERRVGN